MGKFYSLLIRIVLLLIIAIVFNQSNAISMGYHESGDTAKSKAAKITDTRLNKPGIFNRNAQIEFIPFMPFTLMGPNLQDPKSLQTDPSAILNVKVYPVPVADQFNVSYHLNKDANVTIQVRSILGNILFTLFSQRMPAGEQINSFSLASRLSSGIYFLRVIVSGQHPVDKKLLIL